MLQSRGPSSLRLINDLAVYNGHVRLAADGGQRVCCPENKIGVLARFQAADTVGNAEAFSRVDGDGMPRFLYRQSSRCCKSSRQRQILQRNDRCIGNDADRQSCAL